MTKAKTLNVCPAPSFPPSLPAQFTLSTISSFVILPPLAYQQIWTLLLTLAGVTFVALLKQKVNWKVSPLFLICVFLCWYRHHIASFLASLLALEEAAAAVGATPSPGMALNRIVDGWMNGMTKAHKPQLMKGLLQFKFTYCCVGFASPALESP